ncbi:MAG: endonuclease domain-containing protein [Beijerinckiaceae bacterium]|nr:endonuclease domain-containing protein [Beijerinckiaceae bacterium]
MREGLVTSNTHFRRQVALGPYVADFCCLGRRLVIEIDGHQHGSVEGLAHDATRDAFLAAEGFQILRFSNRDVMTSTASVLDTIRAALDAASDLVPSTPTPSPSPQGGGGRARSF